MMTEVEVPHRAKEEGGYWKSDQMGQGILRMPPFWCTHSRSVQLELEGLLVRCVSYFRPTVKSSEQEGMWFGLESLHIKKHSTSMSVPSFENQAW